MPIEIRELVIKATVHKPLQNDQQQSLTRRDLDRLKREILDTIQDRLQEFQQEQQGRY
jgi:hypothetical protein